YATHMATEIRHSIIERQQLLGLISLENNSDVFAISWNSTIKKLLPLRHENLSPLDNLQKLSIIQGKKI
ncbi:hypothetical protein ACJX0J_039497, partial [Zea mays]